MILTVDLTHDATTQSILLYKRPGLQRSLSFHQGLEEARLFYSLADLPAWSEVSHSSIYDEVQALLLVWPRFSLCKSQY